MNDIECFILTEYRLDIYGLTMTYSSKKFLNYLLMSMNITA